MTKFRTGLAALAMGLSALTTAAAANDFPTASVSYSDLDLTSPSGVAALDRRIQNAAHRLCAEHLTGEGAWGPLDYKRCVSFALKSAKPQFDRIVGLAKGERYAQRGPIQVRGR